MIKLPINQVKANPNNPRIIKDDKFKKLVQSIKEFPEMLELRPIVVNDDMVVLGGNMRLKACKEAGLDKVPVIKASNLTEEQQKEFIIKDNVGFGEWDWEMMANEWDAEILNEWGLNVPHFGLDINTELTEDALDLTEEFDPIGVSKDLQRVVFIFSNATDAENWLKKNNIEYKKNSMVWQVDMNIQSI